MSPCPEVALFPLLIPYLLPMFEFRKPIMKTVAKKRTLQSHSCPNLLSFLSSRDQLKWSLFLAEKKIYLVNLFRIGLKTEKRIITKGKMQPENQNIFFGRPRTELGPGKQTGWLSWDSCLDFTPADADSKNTSIVSAGSREKNAWHFNKTYFPFKCV